ncbi:MAG: carboxymuconolactone decarboxylase family protein, partial [Planctomycetota bacterium]
MARLQVVDPATASGRAKEIFDGPLKGKHFNIFKGMANSPAVLDFYLGMGGAASKFELTGAQQEAIQLAVGEANGCGYCVAAHTAIGKGAGLSEEQTVAA